MTDRSEHTTKLTEALCSFVHTIRYSDIPGSVIKEAQRGVLDWIGCALAGSQDRAMAPMLRLMSRIGGRPEATIFGTKQKLGLLDAALLNGQMGNVIDYDDTYNVETTMIHTSSPVLPGLFGLAERHGVSGRDFLSAYVLGFETGARVGHAAPRHLDGGWHLTGTLGTIAAGAAAGKLLGLTVPKLAHTLAISATQAAGMSQNRGTLCKSFHAGRAAMSGVLSALLADEDFDGATDILEGRYGFCRIYSAVAAPDAALEGLGSNWAILKNTYKPYACAVVLHAAIDGALQLRESIQVSPENLASIELCVHPHVSKINAYPHPKTGLQAKINVGHCVALALADGAVGVGQFTPERTLDPKIAEIRSKVKVIDDSSLGMNDATVRLAAGGSQHHVTIRHATGTRENPMIDAQLERKFLSNAEPVIGHCRATRVLEAVMALPALSDAGELTRLCA